MGENIVEFDFMSSDKVNTHVVYDIQKGTVDFVNYTDSLIDKAFGFRETATVSDLQDFLEYRCFPSDRANKDEILKALGLERIGYDPLSIVMRTHGIMHNDDYWVRFKGEENLTYDYVRACLYNGEIVGITINKEEQA